MYHSKQNGGNSFAFYSPEMNAAAVERLMLRSKLRRALERDELMMLYQPKVDLRDGRIVGAEALLRWRLPGHGDIPPSQFIPLAEETNLILGIGEWVLNRVCADYRRWTEHNRNAGRVSINLSLKQPRQASFITRCRSVFRWHQVSPTSFELEITETTLMADPKRTVKLLDELYAMGLHLSIDAILDKNVYIATVSEGGKLQVEMRVKNGRGYMGADRNFDEDLPIGYIPVDSIHSPVRKVNYAVEAARLGQMTDYEKLSLEVWTNGSITPQDAIGPAANLIKDHMSIFINFEEQPEVSEELGESYSDPRVVHLDRSVEELELSVRSYNCLKNANIQTIRELVQRSESEMLKTKNFGRKSLNEIKEILNRMGLSLGMKFDEHGRIIWPPLPSQTAPLPSEEIQQA